MTVTVVLLATALVTVLVLLAAAGAGKLARMDNAGYRAAAAFAAVITLATVVASTLDALLT
ncbi:hypothetical protein ACFWAR_00530 [Streptomyces sp. NPDC059917]|uniref:hypothetical protein n=1 Tax=Streptomyces sp. NPDC059917 TaxID=3347002 RepID=UPI00364D5C50